MSPWTIVLSAVDLWPTTVTPGWSFHQSVVAGRPRIMARPGVKDHAVIRLEVRQSWLPQRMWSGEKRRPHS